MRTSLYDYCREHGLDELLRQWHPSKNEPLTPQTVTYGSKRRIWWLCENGHAWKSVISSRTGKQRCGCSVCAGRSLSQCTAILTEQSARPPNLGAAMDVVRRRLGDSKADSLAMRSDVYYPCQPETFSNDSGSHNYPKNLIGGKL